jgi:transmembrane sensor
MDELILLELEGGATAEQREILLRWRRASEEHERRYQELRATWLLLGRRDEIDVGLQIPTVEGLFRHAAGRAQRQGRRWPRWMNRVSAIAAVLVIGLGVGFAAWLSRGTARVVTAEFRSGSDEPTTAALRDGSVVRLAPGATLRVVLGRHDRVAHLEGRAFFAVAPDPDRPFYVRTTHGVTRVLGTRFEVDAGGDGLRLLVVDGRVALVAGSVETELGAGEMARVSAESPPEITRVEEPEALLDWMGAWVAFEATPLWKVVRDLEIRLGIAVQIADSAIAERTVSGWFAHEDRGRMLSMICRVADVRCVEEGGIVYMRR